MVALQRGDVAVPATNRVHHIKCLLRAFLTKEKAMMGKVIQFQEYQSEEDRMDSMFRAYGRHRARNWKLMQEAADRLKRQRVLQDEQTDD